MPSSIPDYQRTEKRAVAVFGWSHTEVGMPRWQQAEDVGRLAAQNGFTVITGGYGGSMEAVSKGAREVRDAAAAGSAAASAEVVGIVVSEVFPDRLTEGNKYLTKLLDSTSMLHRIEQLTTHSRYFIVLPGTTGTLQELVTIWVQKTIHPSDLPMPVIVAFRDPWEKCCQGIIESLQLSSHQANAIHFVDTPEEAIEWIVKDATGEIDGSRA
ncbi:ribosomal protein L32-like protein [Leishmania donovani]|uniref:Putative lysine decarboxylase family protein n=1 Tax=Leishmania donovani TaxID=5661 RepID=A0A504XBP1_LEIDO|nr:putative lysine decarboxylase family protein [Leishmania donovani]CAJ1993007.1 ribosomal protein L32-like protein [Leishmania donovani]VDZ48836.1 ribosomal_protein_L32-like_protein/GeneDB:LmjF.35.1960 [Leishmania donovani]